MALYLLFAQPLSLQVSLIHFFYTDWQSLADWKPTLELKIRFKRPISCQCRANSQTFHCSTSRLSLRTSVRSLTSCCGSCFYLCGSVFSYCPGGSWITYYHLRMTPRAARQRRRWRRYKKLERERGGWRGASLHRRILSDCLDRLVEFKMQQGPCDVAIKRLPLILPDYFFLAFLPPAHVHVKIN